MHSNQLNKLLLVGLFAAASSILVGCNRKVEVTHAPATPGAPTVSAPIVELDASSNKAELAKKFEVPPCASDTCFFQSSPGAALLTKPGGTPLCKTPDFETQVLVTAFFATPDELVGAECEISESDYREIDEKLGTSNVFKRYLNQRDVFEAFQTWKSPSGYITTYKEVLGLRPTNEVNWAYHLFVGTKEHPQYSKFPDIAPVAIER